MVSFEFMKTLALRLLGHRHDSRFTWGELSMHHRYPKIALEYCPAGMFERNTLILGLIFFTVYLKLPTQGGRGDGCLRGNEPCYGFYTIDNAIVWRWGQIYKSFNWPFFSYNHESTEVLTLDRQPVWIERAGDRSDFRVRFAEEKKAKAANQVTVPYRYTLKSGKVQDRTATVSIERRTWGRKWFPALKLIKTTIDVKFSDEVGERTGSWKGGCIGCGYDMLPGESAIECLRRMERDRKF